MYKVTRKFIAANKHQYEVGDLVQKHVYQKFSRKHKSRCSYTSDTGKVSANLPQATKSEQLPDDVEELQEGKEHNDDNTENEVVAGAVGFGLGAIAGAVGEALLGGGDSPSSDPAPFQGFGGGDGGGGGAGDKW